MLFVVLIRTVCASIGFVATCCRAYQMAVTLTDSEATCESGVLLMAAVLQNECLVVSSVYLTSLLDLVLRRSDICMARIEIVNVW